MNRPTAASFGFRLASMLSQANTAGDQRVYLSDKEYNEDLQYQHFQTKDLGRLKYFLGIKVAQSSSGIVISQCKYALDILEETGMMGCRPIDTPIDPNAKLLPGQGEPLSDPRRYRRLVGKLNYLTMTRPDISFPVSVVS
ncbi:uncharacterized protein LOC107858495 isoform X5 [Capsicum annuum]|uniref:uncharacterized protein LOC107858495 isoform X5 n=1 Tax=Capsicum annuum TaxID=4072 RepID=UPI0007BF8790|nr:uncharacterized protein LOC107858495 isoform X5 [Capsicum annuum]